MATASTAFAIVDVDCAAGEGNYTLAHELGHLMGARHDDTTDPDTEPFAYGHGYRHTSSSTKEGFRTIMATQCRTPINCNPRVLYWSNPNVNYYGVPMGTPVKNNNARVLDETATTVAAFRQTPGQAYAALLLYFLFP